MIRLTWFTETKFIYKEINLMLRNIFLWLVTVAIAVFILEIIISATLLHLYRSDVGKFENETSRISIVNALIQAVSSSTNAENRGQEEYQFRKKSEPSSFNIADNLLGYSSLPGKYVRTYQRKKAFASEWESLKVNVTIHIDGSRWTGSNSGTDGGKPSIYIFGDSFVFGIGVNDEHTFSYLTQQALSDYDIRLFALGGYSLTQAFLNFNRLKGDITSRDTIVLGYGDFYNVRHVLSPSHLNLRRNWFAKRNPEMLSRNLRLPKASIDDKGKINISNVYENCASNDGYCNQTDPSEEEMAKITASLINYFDNNTDAKIVLLHFQGPRNDRVFDMLNDNISVIHATESDFNYFIRDDIEGFDRHPGPHWHYAISRRLIESLKPTH
jgi:hypothetical protein